MAKRPEATRTRGGHDRRRKPPERTAPRRTPDAPPRNRTSPREQRPSRSAPQTNPISRPVEGGGRPKNAAQAKARAKARKAKAPKLVRPPLRERLRERLLVKLSSIELNPRHLVSRVPFVVLVIGALGLGLGVTLWLSTDAAERSYQLGHARQTNQALLQQKEALERDVMAAQAAPALAESARSLGMIPSKDTAHLVQDPSGNWVVVGKPKPAEGVSPPPLNSPLPDDTPAAVAAPAPPAPRVVDPREVTVRVAPQPVPLVGAEVPIAGAVPVPGAIPASPLAPGVVAQGVPLVSPPVNELPPAADGDATHLASPASPTLPGPPAQPQLTLPGPPA